MKAISPMAWITECKVDLPILYVAHPVAPRVDQLENMAPENVQYIAQATVRENLRSAIAWWQWLEGDLTEIVFAMPWFTNVTANGESDPAKIERGLRDDCAIVQRFDGLILCGSRISRGMQLEADAALAVGLPVFQIPDDNGKHPAVSARVQPWFELRAPGKPSAKRGA